MAMIDREELMDRFGGDAEFLAEAANLLREEEGPLREQIRAAIEKGDASALRQAAHSFKGMVSNFCAGEVAEAALKLQLMGDKDRLDGAEEALAELERLYALFDRELGELTG